MDYSTSHDRFLYDKIHPKIKARRHPMETAVPKTWKPKAAGILDIVAGTLGFIGVFFLITGVMVTGGVFDIPGIEDVPFFVPSLISGIALLVAVINVLALIGGIYAVQRKKWWVALVGSIAAFLSSTPLGIAAIILTALSKDEFE
jgi:hypothetical protein